MKRNYLLFLLVSLLGASMIVCVGATNVAPSSRMGQSMIYDPVNQRVLMFGGSMYSNRYYIYDELWSFDTTDNTWTQIETGIKPAPRFHHAMTYIPDTHQIFLFGGWGQNDKIGDTWLYDISENEWRQLNPRNSPGPRSSMAIAYDTENKVVVLFGGYKQEDTSTDETWVYDFTEENWAEMSPENSPIRQYGSGMVYDTVNEKLLLYPGHWSISQTEHGYGDQIWVYDYPGNTWTTQSTTPKPPGRYWYQHTFVEDEAAFLLNGGSGERDEPCNEVWLYKYAENRWEQKTTPTAPAKRTSGSMCYDPGTGKVVLFGGADVNIYQLGDTWILDTETWTWAQVSGETTGGEDEPPQESIEPENGTGIPGYNVQAIILGVSLYLIMKPRRRSVSG